MTTARQSDRAFGLTFAAVFGLVTAVAWFFFDVFLAWALGTAAAFALTALVLPVALLPLNRLWARLALALGRLNNRLVLGIVVFGLITPVGLIMRLMGRDPMNRRSEKDLDTYFSPVGRQADAETLPDMF